MTVSHFLFWKFLQQIWQCPLPSESGNLQLVHTKFPVFWQNVQIQCVFPDRDFFLPFSLFSLCSEDLAVNRLFLFKFFYLSRHKISFDTCLHFMPGFHAKGMTLWGLKKSDDTTLIYGHRNRASLIIKY